MSSIPQFLTMLGRYVYRLSILPVSVTLAPLVYVYFMVNSPEGLLTLGYVKIKGASGVSEAILVLKDDSDLVFGYWLVRLFFNITVEMWAVALVLTVAGKYMGRTQSRHQSSVDLPRQPSLNNP